MVDTSIEFEDDLVKIYDVFYEDFSYSYHFNSVKSDYVEVRYNNGYVENIKDALKNGNVIVHDLDRFNIEYSKLIK